MGEPVQENQLKLKNVTCSAVQVITNQDKRWNGIKSIRIIISLPIINSIIRLRVNFCFIYKVNGGWGPWTDWNDCPVSCGGGEQTRTRYCNNPEPTCNGTDCSVDGLPSTETQKCNENCCPGD